MADVSSIQRDLANTQKQIKNLTDQAKKEEDPKRKADLQKKIVDLNLKRSELDKEMEDLVTSIGVGQELEFAEGFIKWNKYKESKMKKLTEQEKLKVKNFAKRLVEKRLTESATSNANKLYKILKSMNPVSYKKALKVLSKQFSIDLLDDNLEKEAPQSQIKDSIDYCNWDAMNSSDWNSVFTTLSKIK